MIALSGIDCSGKSTQISLLVEDYKKMGKKCKVIWSRGGYTPGIEFLKRVINRGKKRSKEDKIRYSESIANNPMKRRLLFIAGMIDLFIYYSICLRLKGLFGAEIICDRYIWDTYIDYKMKYPEYDFENGGLWKAIIKCMLKPEHSVCLFITSEESMRRSSLKDEPFPEPEEIRKDRICRYYREKDNHRWDTIIDASSSIEDVHNQIMECIKI